MKKLFFLLTLVLLAFSVTSFTFAAFGDNVTVTFRSSYDNENWSVSHAPQSKKIGDALTLDASAYGPYEFAFWVINGVVRDELNATSSIKVQSSMDVRVVFHKDGEHAVLFVDSNGALVGGSYVADGESVTPPSLPGISKPGLVVNASEPWKTYNGITTFTNIDSSRVYVLQYTANPYPVVITLTGATVPTVNANRNDLVMLTAADTVNFKYWKDADGKVLSYNPTYLFTAAKDVTIIAETVDVKTPEALVTMTDDLAVRDEYETFIAQFELLPGQEILEYGFLLSETEVAALTVESAGVTVAKSNNYNPATNEFIMSFYEVTFATIRAYIAVVESSIVEYYYSEIDGFLATDLFISEYIEGGGSNKAIEIFNGTGSPVELSAYSLKLYVNGSSTATTSVSLSGVIANNDVYVVYNSSAIASIKDVGDLASGVTNFNGNDAVALLKNDIVIDVFGVIGEDPGSSWVVGSGTTENHTLVRKSGVSGPTNSWNTGQWDVFSQDTIDYLGAHVFGGISLSDKQSVIIDANEIIIPEEVKSAGNMSLPLTGSRGTTISWSSDTPDVISNAGIVTLPTPSPVYVVLVATVTKGTVVKEVEFELMVGLNDSDRITLDRDAIVLPGSVTEAGNMGLPTSGSNGSTISWSSNTPATITNSGDVVLPASGTVDVTLTATIAYGFSSTTKEFIVTVNSGDVQVETLMYHLDFTSNPVTTGSTTNSYIKLFDIPVKEVLSNGTINIDFANAIRTTTGGTVDSRLTFASQTKGSYTTFDDTLDGTSNGSLLGAGGLRFGVVSNTYTKIEFTFYYDNRSTNQNPASNIDLAVVQYWDGDSWETAKNFLTQAQTIITGSNQTLTIVFDTAVTTTAFRILFDEVSTANNGQLIQPTTLKIYGLE